MRLAITTYLAGLACGLASTTTPAVGTATVALCVALLAATSMRMRLPALLLAGWAWAGLNAAGYLDQLPVPRVPEHAVKVSGRVVDFARPGRDGWAFELLPRAPGVVATLAAPRILVRGFELEPSPGDWCVLWTRLRAPHGLANRGLPDRERAYAARRISATAAVITHPDNHCVAIAGRLDTGHVRRAVSDAIAMAVPDTRAAAVLRALAVADRSALDDAHRSVARATGTAHVLAISGLHVSLAAGLAFVVTRVLVAAVGWYRQSYPPIRAAWWAAFGAALVYAALGGFGIPVMRAACMVGVAALAALHGRRVLSIDSLLAVLALVATLDPFALLHEATWLSFVAVAILVWSARIAPRLSPWRRAWFVHCALAIGLAPLTAAVFGTVPLAAPLANLLVVPAYSLFIVPLTLAGVALLPLAPSLAATTWHLAAAGWTVLDTGLAVLAQASPQLVAAELGGARGLYPLALAWLLCMFPRGLGLRRLALILVLSVPMTRDPPPAAGSFETRVFDVGQGLAILVRTRHHALLYDAGPRWWSGGDAAGSVILPSLAVDGIEALDRLVLSHMDNDHAGGVDTVLGGIRVGRVLAPTEGIPELPRGSLDCGKAQPWRWDGVRFRVFTLAEGGAASRNERSCVLHVAGSESSVLLTGDIEQRAERHLVESHAAALAADVLVVPHHGSRTSSSAEFIAAVAPRVAVVSSGYANRYGMPHASVLARYEAAGVALINTAARGAAHVVSAADRLQVDAERDARWGFWNSDDGDVALPAAWRVW